MTDTRVWRYRWRKKPGRPGPEGPQGGVEQRLFNSPDDVPDEAGWGVNRAHAKHLAGIKYDPAVDGELPESVAPFRPLSDEKAEEPDE